MSSENDDQPGRDGVVGQRAEGGAHHGRARGLAEGAEVRQARGAVAALEHHRPAAAPAASPAASSHLAGVDQRGRQIALGVVREARLQHPRQEVAGLGEGPRPRLARQMGQALKHGASGVMGGPARVNAGQRVRGLARQGRRDRGRDATIREPGPRRSPPPAWPKARSASPSCGSRTAGSTGWRPARPRAAGWWSMTRDGADAARQLTPEGFNVRTRVHEYGGASYVVAPDGLWFRTSATRSSTGRPARRAPEPMTPEGYRYADAVPAPGGGLIAVREDHTDPAHVRNADRPPPGRGRRRRGALWRQRFRRLSARQPGRRAACLDRLGLPGHALGRDAALRGRPDRRRAWRTSARSPAATANLGDRPAVGAARGADLALRRDRLLEPLRRPRWPAPPAGRPPSRVRRPALAARPVQLRRRRRRSPARRGGRSRRRAALAGRPAPAAAARSSTCRSSRFGALQAVDATARRHAGRLGDRDLGADRGRHRRPAASRWCAVPRRRRWPRRYVSRAEPISFPSAERAHRPRALLPAAERRLRARRPARSRR